MKRDAATIAELLPGKIVLIVITATAVTTGFTLGYFVGRSVSFSPESSMLKQSPSSDLAAVPSATNPSSELKNEASSPSLPKMHPPSKESTQASVPPSLGGAIPLTADVRDEEKISPKSQKAAMTEKKAIPAAGEQSTFPSGVSNPDIETRNALNPQSTPKSSPAPHAGSSHSEVVYTVQAAAFKNQKDADTLRQTLEGKGYKVFIKKESGPNGVVLFKVRVGEFEQKKDASVFALKLMKTGGLNAFAVLKN
ncbi:MAG TPA: SPOR domain-containing protein [Thermodesulfovibrionales bacterium]|nr:SPOR domain-containing protein [Thermodesulfovibrionales bacterium]